MDQKRPLAPFVFFIAFAFGFLLHAPRLRSGQEFLAAERSNWKAEWEKTLKAARGEAQVTVLRCVHLSISTVMSFLIGRRSLYSGAGPDLSRAHWRSRLPCWSGPLDPIIPAEKKGFNSKMIIDACRPYEWRDKFPAVVRSDPKLLSEIERKWGELFLTKTSR